MAKRKEPTLLDEVRSAPLPVTMNWLEKLRHTRPELVPQLQELRRAWQAGQVAQSMTTVWKLIRSKGVRINRAQLRMWLEDPERD